MSTEIDGFIVGERIHSGAMGDIFRVTGRNAGVPMIMKLPRFAPGESAESLINFETEAMILPALSGPHVPRVIAVGDLAKTPYIVTEWIEGESLEQVLKRCPLPAPEIVRIGAALADAVHTLHLQDAVHLDLKPDNVILKADGEVALIDFGLTFHARFPDLLAEEQRFAAGSAPYISPEQVLGIRSDPRSDIFSLGVVLYELATGKLPFGVPATMAGLRDRLWLDPVPPRIRSREVPPWLQEIILCCLEPRAENRYQSAALIAFDLRQPDQVALTERAYKSRQAGFFMQARRWWRARGERAAPRRMPATQVSTSRVVLVAVDTMHPDDARHPSMQRTVARILSIPAEYRLICVSVIRGGPGTGGMGGATSPTDPYHDHLVRLRHWVEPLRLPASRLSLHVMESADPAEMLVQFAQRNHVDLIVLGAPSPNQLRLAWWRSVASGVTANAHCSVHVVRVPDSAET
jgi:nucleotide-binding universal stress UspA family protein